MNANPIEGERYYLRMLLTHVRSPKSFQDILLVGNCMCASFREAAEKHGLLEEDNSIENCLDEAIQFQMPFSLICMFATLLTFCTPKNPQYLR